MKKKIALRFTLPVWGERYTEMFLKFALKSLFTDEIKTVLKDNFYTELAIYTYNDTEKYLKNLDKFKELTSFFDNIIFENEFFENSKHILDCFNISNPKLLERNHILHQALKHSLKKCYDDNSYFILMLPEFLYSRHFLSNILSHIMKGKELILFHPLRISFDEKIASYFLNILEKDGYIDENLIFNNSENMNTYTDYTHSLKAGLPKGWKGFTYEFDNSKNVHLKTFYTISVVINPKNLTNFNRDFIECYSHDFWNLIDKNIENSDSVVCMSNLSEGCILDFEIKYGKYIDYKELNKKYESTNKFSLYMRLFTSWYPYRVNSLLDYTYSVDIDKDKMSGELSFIQNSLKNLTPFIIYNKIYHKIRKYIQNITNIYLKKKFFNKLNECRGKDIILIGDGKFILYLFKNMPILKELKIKSISILDYNNYYSEETKLYGIPVVSYNKLQSQNNEKVTYLKVSNKQTKSISQNEIYLFKYKLEYNFISFIFKLFKLFYIRA